MDLSIVTTLYGSAPYLEAFYNRIKTASEIITKNYEVILVNDGSPDKSLEIAKSIHENDEKVKIIDLSRNFGHHKAMMTGLIHAKGELVFLIDCDLEEDPELLNMFYNKIANPSSDIDVVYGVQKKRKGGFFERISGEIFFKVFNFLTNYPVPANIITARLMRKRYVDSLVTHMDREVFIAGLWAITGFRQEPVVVTKKSKKSSTYNLRRKIAVLVNSVTSFSNKPLIYIFYLGNMIFFFSSVYAVYLITRKLFWGINAPGWTSLIVSTWIIGGLIILCLGIIGIYISKIFVETKQRPYTVVKHIYERTQPD